jgi:hypothetical protein
MLTESSCAGSETARREFRRPWRQVAGEVEARCDLLPRERARRKSKQREVLVAALGRTEEG